MPITQLHPGAVTGRRYGSFSGRAPTSGPHTVGKLTELHPGAVTGRRYGKFGHGAHLVKILTQLQCGAVAGRRHGSFARTPTIPPHPPVVVTTAGGGLSWGIRDRVKREKLRKQIMREDEAFLLFDDLLEVEMDPATAV